MAAVRHPIKRTTAVVVTVADGSLDRSGRRRIVSGKILGLVLLTALTMTCWLIYRQLADLPTNDATDDRVGEHVWM